MKRRSRRLTEGEPLVHTNCWVLKLEKASGESGYFFGRDASGMIVLKKLDGKAQRFGSRREAERFARRLEKEVGLDIEEATPEEYVHEPTFELALPGGDPPDGISVRLNERTGHRYLLLCDDGEEIAANDLDDDAADMLVRVLEKIRTLLRRSDMNGQSRGRRRYRR